MGSVLGHLGLSAVILNPTLKILQLKHISSQMRGISYLITYKTDTRAREREHAHAHTIMLAKKEKQKDFGPSVTSESGIASSTANLTLAFNTHRI